MHFRQMECKTFPTATHLPHWLRFRHMDAVKAVPVHNCALSEFVHLVPPESIAGQDVSLRAWGLDNVENFCPHFKARLAPGREHLDQASLGQFDTAGAQQINCVALL